MVPPHYNHLSLSLQRLIHDLALVTTTHHEYPPSYPVVCASPRPPSSSAIPTMASEHSVTFALVLIAFALALSAALLAPCALAFILFLLSLLLQRKPRGPNGQYSPVMTSSDEGDSSADTSAHDWNYHRGRPLHRRWSRFSVHNRQSRSPPRFTYPEEYVNHWQDDSNDQPLEPYGRRSGGEPTPSDEDSNASRQSANMIASIQAVDGHHSAFDYGPRLRQVNHHQIDIAHTSPTPDLSQSCSHHGQSYSDPVIVPPQRRETPYPFEELDKLARTQSLSLPCTIPDRSRRIQFPLPPRESQGSFSGLASLLRDTDEDFLGTPIKVVEADIQKRLDLIGDHSGTWPSTVSPALGGTKRPALPTIVTTHPATDGALVSPASSPKNSSIRWQYPLQTQGSPHLLSSPQALSAVNCPGSNQDTVSQSSPVLGSSQTAKNAVSQPTSPPLVNLWTEQARQDQTDHEGDGRYGYSDGFKGPRAMSAGEIYRRPQSTHKDNKTARRVSYAVDAQTAQSRVTTETESSNSSNERAKQERWRYSLPLQSAHIPLVSSRGSSIKHRPGTPPPRKSRAKGNRKSMSEELALSSDAEREWSNVVQRRNGGRPSKDVYRRGSPYPRNSTPLDDGKSRGSLQMPMSLSVPGLSGQGGGQLSPIPSCGSGSASGCSEKENARPAVSHGRVSGPASFIDTPREELEAKIDEMLLQGESSHSEVCV